MKILEISHKAKNKTIFFTIFNYHLYQLTLFILTYLQATCSCCICKDCYSGLRWFVVVKMSEKCDRKLTISREQYITQTKQYCKVLVIFQVPQILQKIQQQSPSRDFSGDLVEGFERLILSNSLLDIADIRHK